MERVLISHPDWDEVKDFTPALARWVLAKSPAYKVVKPRFKKEEEGQSNAENDNGNNSDTPRTEASAGDSEGRGGRRAGKASQ
jgi:hypothetical protein